MMKILLSKPTAISPIISIGHTILPRELLPHTAYLSSDMNVDQCVIAIKKNGELL